MFAGGKGSLSWKPRRKLPASSDYEQRCSIGRLSLSRRPALFASENRPNSIPPATLRVATALGQQGGRIFEESAARADREGEPLAYRDRSRQRRFRAHRYRNEPPG